MPSPAPPLTTDAHRQAIALDADDPLRDLRGRFVLPGGNQAPGIHLCSHRLGPPARQAAGAVAAVMAQWAGYGSHGGQLGAQPWQAGVVERVDRQLATLLGARDGEVVAMASLGTNLHLLLASFYRPDAQRHAIVIEAGCFTADRHVISAQLARHGRDPARDLIVVPAAPDTGMLDLQALAGVLAREGRRVALVLWPGVHWRSGQAFDLAQVSALAHAAGALAGFDLAHAVGNLPLALHDSGADLAVWCGYKFLCGGPGAPGGLFVHARHHGRVLPQLAGWWGHREASRYRAPTTFDPTPGAAGWQHSPPSPLALAPLAASLEVLTAIPMATLWARSQQLQQWLRGQLAAAVGDLLVPVTPPGHGATLTLRLAPGHDAEALAAALLAQHIHVDALDPGHLRVAVVALYTTHQDLHRLVQAIAHWAGLAPATALCP